MNILFTICGRAGSKGLKNKNIKNLLDEPLIYYTFSIIDLYIKNNKNEDNYDICVSSNSKELLNLSKQCNLNIIEIFRDENLSTDNTAKTEVIYDCMTKCEKIMNRTYDIIVDLDITSPLRTISDLENVINKKKENRKVDVVFTVVNSRRNPYFNMVKLDDSNNITTVITSDFVARQQAPKIYDMNASIYAYESGFLREKVITSIFKGKTDIVEMYDTGVLDIDYEDDLILMEVISKHLFTNNLKFKEIKDNITSIKNSKVY